MLLPFLGKVSLDLITSLKNSICKNLLFCEIEIIFKSSRRISRYFEFKKICPIACTLTSYYKFSCSRYNANYYDKTCWYLSVRVGEHSGVSLLTGKKSKSKKSTAVKDHMFFFDPFVSIDNFKILATSDSDFHVKVRESLLISCDKPIWHKN